MRSTALFLATILISFSLSFATNKNFPILAEVEAVPFGRTLLNVVQLQFKMEHPLEDIATYLYDIQSNLQQAKANEDQEHTDYQSDCTLDLATAANTIETYTNSLNTAQDAYDNAKATEQDKTSKLTAEQGDLSGYQDDLDAEDSANDDAVAEYQKDSADLTDAINACSEALDLLSRLSSSPSLFIQLSTQISNKLEKVREKLAKHLPTSLTIYTPIIDALAQIKSKANPEDVRAVSELISKLSDELTDHLNTLNDNEETRVDNYNNAVTNLQNNIENSEERIDSLKQDITDAQNEEANQQSKIDSYSDLLDAANQAEAARQTQCDDEVAQYNSDTDSRASELTILQKLIDHFESKLASMSDYLSDRTAAFDTTDNSESSSGSNGSSGSSGSSGSNGSS
jgi:chromosome segregation ATPase